MYCNEYDWDYAEPESLHPLQEKMDKEIQDLKDCFADSLKIVMNILYGVKPFDSAELESELENLTGYCDLYFDYTGKELAVESKRPISAYGKMLLDAFGKCEARNG